MQVLAIFPEGIPFIALYSLRMDAQMAIATPDRTLFHKLFGHSDLVLLTRSQQKSDQFILTITTQMDLGAQPTLATP